MARVSGGAGDATSRRSGRAAGAGGAPAAPSLSVEDLTKYRSETLRQYHMIMEYNALRRSFPGGVYVLPDDSDARTWHGVLFVRQGHWRGAVFRFQLTVPPEYPGDGVYPAVRFFAPLPFHPLVHPKTGALELRDQFPHFDAKTKAAEANLALVVRYCKHIFYLSNFNTPRPNNSAARYLYQENQSNFIRKAEESARRSAAAAESPTDASAGIPFLPYSEERHESERRRLLEPYGGESFLRRGLGVDGETGDAELDGVAEEVAGDGDDGKGVDEAEKEAASGEEAADRGGAAEEKVEDGRETAAPVAAQAAEPPPPPGDVSSADGEGAPAAAEEQASVESGAAPPATEQ